MIRSALNIMGQIVLLIVLGVAFTAFIGATHQAIMMTLAQ